MSAKTAAAPKAPVEAPTETSGSAVAEFDFGAGALATAEMPDWMEKSNRGNEAVGAEDVQIPRLEVTQDLTPMVKAGGADVGQLYNSVTSEIYGERVLFVPVMFIKQFLVWKDRKAGGGFMGAFLTQADAQARIHEAVDAGENARALSIAETPTHIGYLIVGGSPDNPKLMQVAISMPRSKIKVSKRLNAMVQMTGGDRFARVYEVSTVMEQKNQDTFYNFNFTPKAWTPRIIYEKAAEMYRQINNATVINVAHEAAGNDTEGSAFGGDHGGEY